MLCRRDTMNTAAKPNVVFIMVDQLSAKWLEAALNGVCALPNLERLKRMGVTLSNAFANNPLCCPARATIATGLTCRGHGLLTNGYRLDPSVPTFMKTLQKAGWRTGAFGKVHFYPFDSEMYPYPDYREYGFDINHVTEDVRVGEWLDWIEREHPSYYDAALATTHNWALELPYFAAYGPEKIDLRGRIRQAKKQIPWADGSYVGFDIIGEGYYPLPVPEEISQSNWITDRAIEFIEDTPPEQPLYAHVSYVQPHSPFCPPGRYLEYVNEELIPEPLGGELARAHYAESGFDWLFMRKLYFADLVHIDRQVGRIMDRLDQNERFDNTYFIFTADHGEMLLDHGHLGKGGRHFDACIRVPLIIAGPGMKDGKVCELPVQHEDICPTVLNVDDCLLGVHPKPATGPLVKEAPSFAGRSLLSLCRGERVSEWRASAYIESYGTLCQSPFDSPWTRTLRNGHFRYSVIPGDGLQEELYDLTADPFELKNVADDPEYQNVRGQLRSELWERIVLQDYPYPPQNLCILGAH